MSDKLPLPEYITNYQGINLLEDCDKEENNLRSYPYLRGQWTTFISVNINSDVLEDITNNFENIDFLKVNEAFHISLIRGHFVLRHHHIQQFIDLLKEKLSIFNKFSVCLTKLNIFKNEENTKCFLCLSDHNCIEDLGYNIVNLIETIENTILQFDSKISKRILKEFKFHTSLCWCKIEFEQQLINLIEKIKEDIEPILIKVNSISVKIGNLSYVFDLN